MYLFLNRAVLQGGVLRPSPYSLAGGPHLVGCMCLLVQFICSYPYRRPFLYLQPEDAPYHGDRVPLHGLAIEIHAISVPLISQPALTPILSVRVRLP